MRGIDMLDCRRDRMGSRCGEGAPLGFNWVLLILVPATFLVGIHPAHARTTPPIIRVRASKALPVRHPARGKSHSTRLRKITVAGNRIPLPIALELLRTALSRPWETAMKDQNRMVCRFGPMLGSHVLDRQGLWCETNEEFFLAQDTGMIPMDVAQFQPGGLYVDPNRLKQLFAKLPPPGTSYTLEVTHHGRIVSEWIIHKGHLVKALHFGKRGPRPAGQGR